MKRIFTFLVCLSAFFVIASADDRPVTFEQLPAEAKSFINDNYKGVKIIYSTKDDDFFRPDYNVMLTNGILLEFNYSGSLKKIEAKKGSISKSLIPEGIKDVVEQHYPGAE